MDATAHGEIILTAVIGGRGSTKALDYAATHLTPEHFEDPRQVQLFILLTRYALQTHGIMTRPALEDLLRHRKAGSRLALAEYYSAVAGMLLPARHQFLHSVGELLTLAAERETGSALATARTILTDPEGVRLDDKTVLSGHEDARSWLLAEMARIEQSLRKSDSPEGDAHDDADDVLAAYAAAKDLQMRGEAPGVLFGVPALDAFIGSGIGPGEMGIILAGTTIGKSRLCVQHAWHASVVQRKHVVYFTTETLRPQICRNLIARHSVLPQFGITGRAGLPGLDSKDIRAGTLSASEESALDVVIKDFKTGDYGRLRVVQMPEHCTVSGLASRFAAIERAFPPDLVIADYLQLFEPDRRSRENREFENLSGILKSFKRWCATARGGRGVAAETPWQVNLGGRQNLRSSGSYVLEDSSGTQEAARTPDIVLALEDREKDTTAGRRVEMDLSALKVRDGPRGKKFPIEADYATCCFRERGTAEAELELDGMPE